MTPPEILNQIDASMLLTKTPNEIRNWFNGVQAGEIYVSPEFNWLGVVEVIGTHYARATDDEMGLEWTRLAISLYDYIIESLNTGFNESLEISEMRLRGNMIRKYGIIPGDPVLDASIIFDWFFRGLTLTFEEAARQAEIWMTLDILLLRDLRWIKNRLAVVISLNRKENIVALPTDLENWVALFPKLP